MVLVQAAPSAIIISKLYKQVQKTTLDVVLSAVQNMFDRWRVIATSSFVSITKI